MQLEHPYINMYIFKCPECHRPVTVVWRTRTKEEGNGRINRLSCPCGWNGIISADSAEARIHHHWPYDIRLPKSEDRSST